MISLFSSCLSSVSSVSSVVISFPRSFVSHTHSFTSFAFDVRELLHRNRKWSRSTSRSLVCDVMWCECWVRMWMWLWVCSCVWIGVICDGWLGADGMVWWCLNALGMAWDCCVLNDTYMGFTKLVYLSALDSSKGRSRGRDPLLLEACCVQYVCSSGLRLICVFCVVVFL